MIIHNKSACNSQTDDLWLGSSEIVSTSCARVLGMQEFLTSHVNYAYANRKYILRTLLRGIQVSRFMKFCVRLTRVMKLRHIFDATSWSAIPECTLRSALSREQSGSRRWKLRVARITNYKIQYTEEMHLNKQSKSQSGKNFARSPKNFAFDLYIYVYVRFTDAMFRSLLAKCRK